MKNLLLSGTFLLTNLLAHGQLSIVLQQAATGLSGAVDIEHAGDDRLFVVRQPGTISVVAADMTVLPTPFLNIQSQVTSSGNEMGLLGIAFHPDYANNGFFYVNYTNGNGASRISRISRFVVSSDPNVADPNSEFVILEVSQPFSNHNAGDLMFGSDGYLYIPWGDGGSAGDPGDRSQDLMEPMGKIFRIDIDNGSPYAIPPSNPFANAVDTLPEIWGIGLRNPWRASFDRLTNDLWIGDVGQNAREEVDFWPSNGAPAPNFGWRCVEGDIPFNTAGCLSQSSYVGPVSVHDNIAIAGGTWCSVIGGRVYRGSAFPQMQGQYIYTDYCATDWYMLESDGMGGFMRSQIASNTGINFIAAIGEDVDGELFAARESNGIIYRICPDEPPVLVLDGNGMLTATDAVTYTWFLDGVQISDTTQILDPMNMGGDYFVVADIGNGCTFQSNTVTVSPSSVGVIDITDRIRLFPNPTDASMFVELSNTYQGEVSLEILDVRGQLVKTIDAARTSFRIDTKELSNGQYNLTVRVNGQVEDIKSFVVAH